MKNIEMTFGWLALILCVSLAAACGMWGFGVNPKPAIGISGAAACLLTFCVVLIAVGKRGAK